MGIKLFDSELKVMAILWKEGDSTLNQSHTNHLFSLLQEKSLGDTLEIWVEFRPAAGVDYLEYLTLEVIKEPDGWKILSYGLEL